jgi:hypothetical protein
MPAPGDAFFFSVSNSHLWVVISNPDGQRGEFLMVNLTTLSERTVDESCVLKPVDYPHFITHETIVFYDDAKLWWTTGANGYDELNTDGKINPMPPLSTSTLLKIQQGALASDFFIPDYIPLVQASLAS